MSLRWRIILAVALLGGGVLGYRSYQSQVRLQAQLADWEATEEYRRPLAKVVTMQFGREVTLPEWLDEFTRQTGLQFEPPVEEGSKMFLGDGFDRLLIGERRFVLDLPPMPALEALRTLSAFHDIHWLQHASGDIEWQRNPHPMPLFARVYAVPPDLRLESAELALLVTTHVKPSQWADAGGPCSVQTAEGSLTILQGLDAHLATEQFLNRLFAALHQVHRATPVGLSEHDPIWNPICLDGEPEDIAELQAALDRPITLKANDVHAQDFVASLSEQAKFSIGFHGPEAITKPNISLVRFTCDLQGLPLREVLREAGVQEIMGFAPAAGGRMLFISPLDHGQAMSHHILFAYPVADFDLVTDVYGNDDELLDLITSVIDDDSWQDVGGPSSMESIAGGKLLLIWQTLDNHRRIRELLIGLRAIRGGQKRTLAIEPHRKLPANPPVLNARLNYPCEIHYCESLLLDAVRDVAKRTGVSFGALEHTLQEKRDQIWCHLPAAPLRENMQLLIAATDHDYYNFELVSELATPWTEIVDNELQFVTEIFDLRPRLVGHGGPEITDLIGIALEPDNWADLGGAGRLNTFRNCLVAHAHPRTMARLRDMLTVLEEHLASRSPKVWRGEPLTEEALNRPLAFRSASDPIFQWQTALAARNERIRRQLLEPVSLDFPELNLGQAILTVARRYDLPIVLHALPKNFRPSTTNIRLSADQEPLGSVLQRLAGDPEEVIWRVDGGYLTVVAPHEVADQETGFLYSVDDLVLPRGRLLPGQLIRTIQERLENTDGDIDGVYPENRLYPSAEAFLHFGNLLWLRASPEQPGRAIVEDILRRLRSGELKPLPRRPGDERYYSHPYRHPHFAVPEPVFGM